MRATLFLVCRGRLLEKQIGLLLSIQNQMYPTFDISVRFFGIDWQHLFRISQGLIQRVEQLSETLLGTKLESLPPASGGIFLFNLIACSILGKMISFNLIYYFKLIYFNILQVPLMFFLKEIQILPQ